MVRILALMVLVASLGGCSSAPTAPSGGALVAPAQEVLLAELTGLT